MNILVISDLHNEFSEWQADVDAVAAADVVVLAGDIHTGAAGIEWAARQFGGKPTVYVAGNHEYYGGHWDKTLDELRCAAVDSGISFLEENEVVIQGVRFLGCSLWTDFRYFGDGLAQQWAMNDYASGLMDCKAIKARHPIRAGGYLTKRLTPAHVLKRHMKSRKWLEAALSEPFDGPTVVVTHHLPHRGSVAERFVNDTLTPGFVVDLPVTMLAKADLWIHGHTHDSCAYTLADPLDASRECLVVCNPRGYPLTGGGTENGAFNPRFTVRLGGEKIG